MAIDDPAQRRAAELRAGFIDGCVENTTRQGTAGQNPDALCTCLVDAVTAGPADDVAQIQAVSNAVGSEAEAPRLQQMGQRCAAQVQGG